MKKFNFRKTLLLLSIFALSSVSIFAQVDVPRQTLAITYPLEETVTVKFRGTTRFPRISGSAKVKRTSKNGTEIDFSIDNMPRPFELGPGYATYVVWAISPDGQADNLGEIKRRGFLWFDSKMSVTTPLQSFSLLVTAEPHFLVRRPSRQVMIENVSGVAKSGAVLPTARTVQFLGNDSDYFRDPRTPEIAEAAYKNTPSAVLQAKQAIALARYAGAQTDATAELQQAEALLRNAEDTMAAGRAEEQVDLLARQSISAAVKAEDTANVRREARARRNEKTKQDAELQRSEDRVADAMQQMESLKAELASEQRARELAERDVANLNEQVRQLRAENARLSEDLGRVRTESEGAKVRLARLEGEKQVVEQQRDQESRLNRLRTEMPILMQSLKSYGAVKQTDRGIILTLNETYWSGIRNTEFAPVGETKLNNLSNILLNNRDYSIVIESHTDDKGNAADLQNLTDGRAQTLMTKLSSNGVEQNRFEVKGYGSSVPLVPNTTNANRAKNRRIDVILVPSV